MKESILNGASKGLLCNRQYTTVIHIEYDYALLAPVEYDEHNILNEAYLLPFNELKSIPYADFITPNYLENRLKDFIQDIDTQNTEARVEFTFRFGGWVTNNDHLPFPSSYRYYTTLYEVYTIEIVM